MGSVGALTSPMGPGRGTYKVQEHQGPAKERDRPQENPGSCSSPSSEQPGAPGGPCVLQVLSGMFLMEPVATCRSPAGPGTLPPSGRALLLCCWSCSVSWVPCLAGGGCRLGVSAIPHGVLRAAESLPPPGDQSKKANPSLASCEGDVFFGLFFSSRKTRGFQV